MVFSEHINRMLQTAENCLQELRESLASDPPDSVYAVQFTESEANDGEDPASKVFYSKSHPMVGYRYQIPSANEEALQPRFFMNDIVLLHLEKNDAKELKDYQKSVTPTICKEMININTTQKLKYYMRPDQTTDSKQTKPPVNILVKGLQGKLISNRFQVKQLRQAGWSYYLLFILYNG